MSAPSTKQQAKAALADALYEVERASRALEEAIDTLDEKLPAGATAIDLGDGRVERLIRVAKSLLNADGVFTPYDLALAIRAVEGHK